MRLEIGWRILVASIALGGGHALAAQSFLLDLPLKSPHASIAQRVALTDIAIAYSRPSVRGRTIWGGLVPYGEVWRTGANVNTTISFSDPVLVDGKPLDRGTYGLHTIPTARDWTEIFSRNSTSWGSFTYDPAEDALRISVKPQEGPMHEALTFEFDDVQPDSVVVRLSWEKLAVPFKVSVDAHRWVRASLDRQLRTLARYNWMSWNDAASYLLGEKIDLDDALAWADRSIAAEDRFENQLTKSKVLAELGRATESAAAQRRAVELGNAGQLHGLARDLLAARRNDDAFAVFRENAKRHPGDWIVHEGLARAASAQGKFDVAKTELGLAIAGAPKERQEDLEALVKRVEAMQDINP
jgi:hypothetical protein